MVVSNEKDPFLLAEFISTPHSRTRPGSAKINSIASSRRGNSTSTNKGSKSFCPIRGQLPYLEAKTNKLRFCYPFGKKRNCPRPYTCQFSPTMKRNICCGKQKPYLSKGEKQKAKLEDSGTDDDSVEAQSSDVAAVVGPKTARVRSRGRVVSTPISEHNVPATTPRPESVCDKGLPFMVNGLPQTCTAMVCPSNYRCVFSKVARNYYCCSKENAVMPGAHG